MDSKVDNQNTIRYRKRQKMEQLKRNSIIAWIPILGMFTASFKLAYVPEKNGVFWAIYQIATLYIILLILSFKFQV